MMTILSVGQENDMIVPASVVVQEKGRDIDPKVQNFVGPVLSQF
jgi:hypothetical protein